MSIEYAIIVKNKTRLESLIERFNTRAQAKFYIESYGGNFKDYEIEHSNFQHSLTSLQTQLSKIIKHKIIDRDYLPSYLFSKNNLIIVIGQDGLVANTAKYSNNVPIIAVNPDINRYDGILLPFNTSNFLQGVILAIENKAKYKTLRFAEAKLNNNQRLLAFNDLFIGASSHISARYRISYNNKTEEQSSSGIIVSTLAGSTGWLSSIFNMAYGITNMYEEKVKHKKPLLKEDQLLFAVREPFKSIRTEIGIIAGFVQNSNKLVIESLMPSKGLIFSDGIENDFLEFNSGSIVKIGLADEKAYLIINNNATQQYI